MKPGYTQALYLLPFDHRDSYVADMFHLQFPLTDLQQQKIVGSKQVIYEGLLAAGKNGALPRHAGILVDEQFGSTILRDAGRRKLVTALSVEKSGSAEFEFEYGSDFAAHIELFKPTFAKVLMRYNPEGDADLNERQLSRLVELSAWCRKNQQRFMLELLVPATADQLRWYHADAGAYDRKCRPGLMVQAMCAIQDAGIEPDVWKIEGVDKRIDYVNIVEAAQRNGRSDVGCIVLGRNADEKQIADWLSVAAGVDGMIGFAIGRTTFWSAIAALCANRITREEAVTRIAQRYRMWADIFDAAKSSQPAKKLAK